MEKKNLKKKSGNAYPLRATKPKMKVKKLRLSFIISIHEREAIEG